MNRSRHACSAGLAALIAAGCATPPAAPRFTDADYPGVLRSPSALAIDVVWQQRVTANWRGGGERGFDAVVQKSGDTLTVIGLSPFGSTGYAVILRGSEIELRNDTSQELPFPPRFILLDVQRVFFPWLPDPVAGFGDGQRQGLVDGEWVVERWRDGHLVERSFTRSDGRPPGTITIRYQGQRDGGTASKRAVLDNGWFGYRLTVDTSAEQLLPTEAAN